MNRPCCRYALRKDLRVNRSVCLVADVKALPDCGEAPQGFLYGEQDM